MGERPKASTDRMTKWDGSVPKGVASERRDAKKCPTIKELAAINPQGASLDVAIDLQATPKQKVIKEFVGYLEQHLTPNNPELLKKITIFLNQPQLKPVNTKEVINDLQVESIELFKTNSTPVMKARMSEAMDIAVALTDHKLISWKVPTTTNKPSDPSAARSEPTGYEKAVERTELFMKALEGNFEKYPKSATVKFKKWQKTFLETFVEPISQQAGHADRLNQQSNTPAPGKQ